MWPPSALVAASVALLALASAAAGAQRTSPQFSFPSAQSQQLPGSQFGADLFGANSPDLSLLSASQASPLVPSVGNSAGQQQAQAQQSPFVALGAPQLPQLPQSQQSQSQSQQQGASLGPLMPEPQFPPPPALPAQLVASSPALPQLQPLQPQQHQPQARQQARQEQTGASQPSTIQLARPSLSLTSLSSLAQQPQTSQPSARSTQSSASSGQLQQQQQQPSSRHAQHSTSTSSSSSSSSVLSSRSIAPTTSSQKPATAAPAAAAAAGSQHSVESARRFVANSASLAASSGQTFSCPDSFGFFRHHKSCDKYWACENGTATLKLCGNGLMFDDSDPRRENCAYPFSVDCGSDRTDLEPPISTPNCPRLYGLFSDNTNCRVFYSCWNGEASKYECPPGLAYDAEQRVCVWADLVDRCDQSEVSDGFVCPDPTEADQPGHYTRHPHVTDCRKFYVCIEGVARPYGCSFGTVFNVDSLQCDEPENVSGCEKYYGDLDPKLAKKLARESAQGNPGPASTGSSHSSSSSSSSSRSGSTNERTGAPKDTAAKS